MGVFGLKDNQRLTPVGSTSAGSTGILFCILFNSELNEGQLIWHGWLIASNSALKLKA